MWENVRDEPTSWSTPMPVEVDGRLQVIISATNMTRSYDVETGDLIWECSGQTLNAIPTPVLGFGNVYCTSGYVGASLQAINLHAKGDVSDSDAIAWQIDEGTPYIPSPVLYGDKIYFLESLKAVLSCYKADTGEAVFVDQRLEGMKQMYASPVAAGGRIYISDMLLVKDLPQEAKEDMKNWVSCLGGAEPKDVYLGRMTDSGFKDIEIMADVPYGDGETWASYAHSMNIKAAKPA
ncbi:MAG: hypothetical protein IH940_10520 [Acidobacteria bacterium]|nr:hypothetical protein [Acidobacteriota bacterium]